MCKNSRPLLLSPLFLIGLFLLLLNDFYLKAAFSNFLTGKLSDFAGLFIFPLFWSAFFPKRKMSIYISTALFFIFWKSSFSQFIIDGWNSFGIFSIGRVVDFTDLIALAILPFSYLYSSRNYTLFFKEFRFTQFARISVIAISIFAFTATSSLSDRSIFFPNEYKTSLDKDQINLFLRQNKAYSNVKFRRDDEVFDRNAHPNVNVDLKTYFVDVELAYDICESKKVKYSFILESEKNYSKIRSTIVSYKCDLFAKNSIDKEELTKKHKDELLRLFEGEILYPLRQNSTQ